MLHRRSYRETSYIADFFTLESGKISAVVKGVRNSKSDRKSLLQPFQPLSISLVGRHELKNLTQIEAHAPAMPLQGNHLYCGMYVNEIINRCLQPQLASPELFQHYHAALSQLMTNAAAEPVLRTFEQQLLQELGVVPDLLTDCHSGENIVAEGIYQFQRGQGVTATRANGGKNVFSGQSLLNMHQGCWNKAALRTAKQINRLALSDVLGDKPLKSRELFLRY